MVRWWDILLETLLITVKRWYFLWGSENKLWNKEQIDEWKQNSLEAYNVKIKEAGSLESVFSLFLMQLVSLHLLQLFGHNELTKPVLSIQKALELTTHRC